MVVVPSRGPAFCAGADLNWMRSMAVFSHADNHADALKVARMFHAVHSCSSPVIARVQGDAFGGGVGLAAACDIVVAAEAAHFALSEVKLGIVAATISPHLVRAMGARQAARYMLTAEKFTASQARTLGLVHEVTLMDGLDREVERIAHHLAGREPRGAWPPPSACSPTWSKLPWTTCCWPPPRSASPMRACRPKAAKVSPRFSRKARLPGRRRSSP